MGLDENPQDGTSDERGVGGPPHRPHDAQAPVYATPGVTGLGPTETLLAPVRPSIVALQDALATVLGESADDPATTAEVASLARVITGAQAALLDRVDGVDRAGTWALDGSVSIRTWLSGQTRMTRERAAETVRVARSLRSKPATRDDLASGEIRLEHAEHTTRALDRLAAVLPDSPPDPVLDERGQPVPGQPDPADWLAPAVILDETEQALLLAARHLDARELGVEIRRRTAALAPLTRGREDDDLNARRSFSMRKDYDGGSSGRFRFGTEDGALLRGAIEAWRRTDHHGAGDTRTPTQRDADALIGLIRAGVDAGSLPTQHGHQPHLLVLVPWNVWIAEQELRPASTATYADGSHSDGTLLRETATYADSEPVLPATVRRLTCDARITRIVLDPAGRPIDVGRTQRTISSAIFLAAALRDGGCAAKGCRAGPDRCEGHHATPWALGGDTSLENTKLLCKGRNGHHHQIHDQGRTIELDDGRWLGPEGFTDPPGSAPPW